MRDTIHLDMTGLTSRTGRRYNTPIEIVTTRPRARWASWQVFLFGALGLAGIRVLVAVIQFLQETPR